MFDGKNLVKPLQKDALSKRISPHFKAEQDKWKIKYADARCTTRFLTGSNIIILGNTLGYFTDIFSP